MSNPSIAVAASLALSCHAILYLLLNLWPAPEIVEQKKSMPVTLISPSNPAVNAQTQTPNSRRETRQSRLTSQSENEFKIDTNNEQAQINKQTTNSSNTQTSTKSVSETRQQNRTQRADASVKSLFTNNNETSTENVPVISSQQTEELSPYQQALIKHLLAGKLYDRFHSFMAGASQNEINYLIELRLFENGAIKSANLIEKSNSVEIDKLAITAAYNASPYPRPPTEDFKIDYIYAIPMSYKRNNSAP
jgi:hypothetical protein